MLPEKLSNGLCSLNPQVDRLVLVCDAVITAKGVVKAYQFYNAVMHSAARLTYNEVWEAFSDAQSPAARRRAELMPQLEHLYNLFKVLLEARHARGAMDLDTVETMIISNAQGKIEKILPRRRNDAHRLIEECMLTANVCAADFLIRSKHPSLFRIHEGPTPEKLQNLHAFLKTLSLSLGGGESPTAQDYAKLVSHIGARPDKDLLQSMILRSMQQAIYSPYNAGHFGLAYEAYTHFTSPIRRYPDLLVHRTIKALLAGKTYLPASLDDRDQAQASAQAAAKSKRRGKPAAAEVEQEAKRNRAELLARWEQIGLWLSSAERRADEASRDVEAWLKCYFMKERVGDAFTGHISGVAPFGVFVTLDSLFVEGLVHVSELGSEYFQYNEAMHELRGERSGRRFRLTDPINIQIARVDLEARRIEFRLVQGSSFKGFVKDAKPVKLRPSNAVEDGLPVFPTPAPSSKRAKRQGKAAVEKPAQKAAPKRVKAAPVKGKQKRR
jgi:ribonuclease R